MPCTTAPELFFSPDRQERPDEHATRVAAAKRICSGCTIRATCGAWALENREWGIWGGHTEAEHGYRPTTRRLVTHTEAAAA